MIAKAIISIDINYKRDIQKLLDEALQAKRLDEAVALKEELLRIGVLGSYRTSTNKGLFYTLMDGGICTFENQGPSGFGKWEIKGGRLLVAVGDWSLDLDPVTNKGQMSHRGAPAKPETVVKS